MASIAVWLLAGTIAASLAPDATASDAFRRQLAERHAPIIFQGLGSKPEQDVFTRHDFDGDTVGDNNWENFGRYPTPPEAYYDVIETASHWYITYAFFYPRDYSVWCIGLGCHENDLEGARLVIHKDGSPAGRLVLLETLAHDIGRADTRPRTIPAPHSRAVIVIEAGGHGIHSINERRPDRRHQIYSVSTTSGSSLAGSRSYGLRPLWELWTIRSNVGRHLTWAGTYDYRGTRFALDDLPTAFSGRHWNNNRAKPPWGWRNKNRPEARGEWFLDPAMNVCRWLSCGSRHSLDYVYHPYLSTSYLVGS